MTRIRKIAAGLLLAGLTYAGWTGFEAHRRAVLTASPPTKLLLDRHGRFLGEVGQGPDEPLGYWAVDPIPPRVASAMIAIEDKHFWAHSGVDFRAVGRAVVQNATTGRRVSGASTIAMQVARMQDPGPRTYRKKAVEALTAIFLVQRYGRMRVLGHYLRIAPYGNRIRGIGFAAKKYFDKPVEDLSWAEIAFLAAIPQSPSRMNPYEWRGYARAVARGQRILDLLAERGVLKDPELSLARAQLDHLSIPAKPARSEVALHAILRLKAQVADQENDPIVRTSLDLALMEQLSSTLDEAVYGLQSRGAENGAMIVADRTTSEVLVYLGSARYFDDVHAGAIDFADTPRPSGSTLKPFVYAMALDRGVITPVTILDDLFRAKGGVSNADDRFLGPLLPRTALANSRNVPAANLAEAVGLGPTYDLLHDLGLHRREKPASHYGLGLVLGLLPVTLYDLVGAYSALSADGRVRPLTMIPGASPQKERVVSEDAARQVTLFLSDPMARLPTFPRMGASEYPFPVALKTGTSQSYRDAWTVAYTDRYLIGVWLGRPDAAPMNRLGGTTAAGLVRRAIDLLHEQDADGLSDLSFEPPADHPAVPICPLSGRVATPHCERTIMEHLRASDIPPEPCDVHIPVTNGDGQRVLVQLPPRYAAWAEAEGLETPGGWRPPWAGAPSQPRILRPEDGARVMFDPEVPREQATLALLAAVDPGIEQVVWYVDGRPFATVGPPFSTRWPLTVGDHVFEARVPYSPLASTSVRVIVDP